MAQMYGEFHGHRTLRLCKISRKLVSSSILSCMKNKPPHQNLKSRSIQTEGGLFENCDPYNKNTYDSFIQNSMHYFFVLSYFCRQMLPFPYNHQNLIFRRGLLDSRVFASTGQMETLLIFHPVALRNHEG